MTTRAEGIAAGRKAQSDADAFVQGAKDPRAALKRRPVQVAPAGLYELVALEWNEPRRDNHGRRYTVKHRRGDLVELSHDDAERLLSAGAVKPTTAEGEAYAATLPPTPTERAIAHDAEHPLAVPAPDAASAEAADAPVFGTVPRMTEG